MQSEELLGDPISPLVPISYQFKSSGFGTNKSPAVALAKLVSGFLKICIMGTMKHALYYLYHKVIVRISF